MIVAIDIDGVLAKSSYYNPIDNYLIDDWDAFVDSIPNDKPIYEGLLLAKSFINDGNDVYIVSARVEEARENTTKWLREQGLFVDDDKIILRAEGHYESLPPEYKLWCCTNLNPDLVIEDDIKVAELLTNEGFNVILLLRSGWNV